VINDHRECEHNATLTNCFTTAGLCPSTARVVHTQQYDTQIERRFKDKNRRDICPWIWYYIITGVAIRPASNGKGLRCLCDRFARVWTKVMAISYTTTCDESHQSIIHLITCLVADAPFFARVLICYSLGPELLFTKKIHSSEIVQHYCRYLEAFQHHVGINEPIVIGHSFGGFLMTHCISANPKLASKLREYSYMHTYTIARVHPRAQMISHFDNITSYAHYLLFVGFCVVLYLYLYLFLQSSLPRRDIFLPTAASITYGPHFLISGCPSPLCGYWVPLVRSTPLFNRCTD
jgi:hypothetical protein